MTNWAKKTLNNFSTQLAPLRLTIELTAKCNFNCIHCYHAEHNISNELTLEEILNVVSQFKRLGLFHVTLTGGEPFLRNDFEKIIEELSKMHLKIDVYTNASLITEKNVKILKKPCIQGVQVSIYGNSEKVYNTITGTTQNFFAYKKALELLSSNNIATTASIMLMKANYHEMADMQSLCQKHGFDIQYGLRLLNDRNNISKNCFEISNIEKLNVIRSTIEKSGDTLTDSCYDRKQEFICTAGTKGYNLTSTGEITPCTGYYRPLGNIRKMSVYEIINSSEALDVKNTRISDIRKCRECNNLNFCTICPGIFYSENNTVKDFEYSSLCDETQIVKKAFIE